LEVISHEDGKAFLHLADSVEIAAHEVGGHVHDVLTMEFLLALEKPDLVTKGVVCPTEVVHRHC
jgi:hypothetical protein